MGIGNIANSGMNAAMKEMEAISNNIANANTIGFKASHASFADIYPTGSGGSSVQPGLGVSIKGITQDFSTGSIESTGRTFDLHIGNGSGFFVVRDANSGATTYTRAGQFSVDKDGYLTGYPSSNRVQGYLATGGVVNSGSVVGDLLIDKAPRNATATTTITPNLNLDVTSAIPLGTFSDTDPTTYNNKAESICYDSLGNVHKVDIFYINAGSNTWTTEVEVDGTSVGSGSLTFSTSGQLTGSTGMSALTYVPGTGAVSPQALSIDHTGTTQFASSYTVRKIEQNGYNIGEWNGYSVDSDGNIKATYSNNESVLVGKVAVATFPSIDGLGNVGSMSWQETTASGSPIMNVDSSNGVIGSGQLELSNVDLTEEMINLIDAQHGFQANAQVEEVFNQVMQTVIKL